ncbi:hypothetical protein [Chromobacterium vaccinii]|uniref:hypothetical protein n=1 Tax=Chromobacterium vaccinii TaxID=1108595 RepID=UPI001319FED4|nr:hypothetical protein [Chromobacterium vaccinii]
MPLQDNDMISVARAAELLGIPRTKIKTLSIPRYSDKGTSIRYRFGDVADFATNHADELTELRSIHNRNANLRLQRQMERRYHGDARDKISKFQARRLPDGEKKYFDN